MFTGRTSRREEIFEHHVTEFHGGRKALSVQRLAVLLGWIRGAVDKQGSVDPTWEGREGGVIERTTPWAERSATREDIWAGWALSEGDWRREGVGRF